MPVLPQESERSFIWVLGVPIYLCFCDFPIGFWNRSGDMICLSSILFHYYNRQVSTKPDFNQQNIHRFSYRFQTPRYSWNTAKVGVKQQSINQSIHIQHLISTMSSTNYVYCNGHKSHLNLFLICKTKHTYPKVSRRKWENTSNILEFTPSLLVGSVLLIFLVFYVVGLLVLCLVCPM